VNDFLATILTPPLLPIALAQGYWTRKRTPRLPDAAGPDSGIAVACRPRSSASFHPNSSLKLIVLGESTVAGMGARTHEFALTGQTAAAIARHCGRSVGWQAIGESGITARAALAALVPRLVGQSADLVVMVLGVNDSIGFTTAARWAADVDHLVQAVRAQVGAQPIVLAGVPPMNVFPALSRPLSFVLGARARVLDTATAKLAARLSRLVHVPFEIDGGRELFCADGFHPSELGYKLWGEQLGEIAAAHLL
jgi:lysophospholipase L1-like esterase